MAQELDFEHKRLLSTPAAARFLAIGSGTLANWRLDNKGPKYLRAGRKILYDIRDLNEWIETQKIDPRKVSEK